MASESPVFSLSTQEVAALAEYFRIITAAGSFPPGSGSYSGNIPDLNAVVSRLDTAFLDSLDLSLDPTGLQLATPGPGESPSHINDVVSSSNTLVGLGNDVEFHLSLF